MKKFVLGMILLSSNFVFAQADFDHKAERKRLNTEVEVKSDKIQSLYSDLYDAEGQVVPAVQAQIDNLTRDLYIDFAKTQYLWTVGFEDIQDKYQKSDTLKHFKRASNRFAAVTVKDSKGQVISHDSLGELIDKLYDQDISKKYGCYDEEAETSLPYEENQAKQADAIMQTLGYADYKQLMTANQKTFCEIDEISYDRDTEIIQCNDFISGVRISLLETLEKKVIQKSKEITRTGYLNASDELFTEYEVTNNIKNAVEEQISNIEAACIDRKLQNTDEVFNYLESEVEKDGFTIEYTNLNTGSTKVILE